MMAPSPGTRSFVGRTSEVASLDELLRRAAEGPCQVGLIEGEAGIGKSRLVTEVLHRARGLGFQPYIGAAAELERDRPFGALVEALDLHPHRRTRSERRSATCSSETPNLFGAAP